MPASSVDGHQRVAVGAERVDQAGQRLDGAAAVAAGVVQQHHLARRSVRCRPGGSMRALHDDAGVGVAASVVLPVVGVDAQADDQIAQLLGDQQRRRPRCGVDGSASPK